MSKALLAGLFAFAFAGLALGCTPEVPAHPTYTSDVKGILDAHCVRCHGQNDMLNTPPPETIAPMRCYLQRYENQGDCTVSNPPCMYGAGDPACYQLAANYIFLPDASINHMPPLPSLPLSDWEKDVITKWVADKAPQ